MFPPHRQDTDQEGERGNDHLPGLACAELTMVTEYLEYIFNSNFRVGAELCGLIKIINFLYCFRFFFICKELNCDL